RCKYWVRMEKWRERIKATVEKGPDGDARSLCISNAYLGLMSAIERTDSEVTWNGRPISREEVRYRVAERVASRRRSAQRKRLVKYLMQKSEDCPPRRPRPAHPRPDPRPDPCVRPAGAGRRPGAGGAVDAGEVRG